MLLFQQNDQAWLDGSHLTYQDWFQPTSMNDAMYSVMLQQFNNRFDVLSEQTYFSG